MIGTISDMTLDSNDVMYTYLMYDGRAFKIGQSTNPKNREISIKTGNPFIKLLTFGTGVTEAFLHKTYSKKRIELEWFNLTSTDVSEIVNLIEHGELRDIKYKLEYEYTSHHKHESPKTYKHLINAYDLSRHEESYHDFVMPYGKYKGLKLQQIDSNSFYKECMNYCNSFHKNNELQQVDIYNPLVWWLIKGAKQYNKLPLNETKSEAEVIDTEIRQVMSEIYKWKQMPIDIDELDDLQDTLHMLKNKKKKLKDKANNLRDVYKNKFSFTYKSIKVTDESICYVTTYVDSIDSNSYLGLFLRKMLADVKHGNILRLLIEMCYILEGKAGKFLLDRIKGWENKYGKIPIQLVNINYTLLDYDFYDMGYYAFLLCNRVEMYNDVTEEVLNPIMR